MTQFDQAVGAHNQAPKLIDARAKRSSAETSCKAGNFKSGISDVRNALNVSAEAVAVARELTAFWSGGFARLSGVTRGYAPCRQR